MVRAMSEPTDETVGNDNEPEQREFERINGSKDNFAPPAEPCECWCLHCRRTFMSSEIWFQKVINARSGFDGFWMCPTPNCTGAGFTFDIFPTDPEHPANDGWSYDDGEEEGEEEWDEQEQEEANAEAAAEWDPDETRYKELDEIMPEDDDIAGEEWKFGLEPGAAPPAEWSMSEEAQRELEEEERLYNLPDERPRVLDWSNREESGPSGDFDDDDIPF